MRKVIIILAIALIGFPHGAGYSEAADELLAHYKLDMNFKDASGYGHNLSLGSAFEYGWVEGEFKRAIQVPTQLDNDVDGSRTRQTPHASGLYYPGTGGWTVMGWALVEEGKHGYIIQQYTPLMTGREPYRLVIWDWGEFFFHIQGDWEKISAAYPTTEYLGEWVHVAGVYEFQKSVKLYLNGELKATTPTSVVPETLTGYDTYIGGNTWGNDRGLVTLDDIKVFNYALTEAQIVAAMAGPDPGDPALPGDMDRDDTITPQDALCVLQSFVDICPTVCAACWDVPADIDGQDGVTPADAFCILQKFVGLPSCLD